MSNQIFYWNTVGDDNFGQLQIKQTDEQEQNTCSNKTIVRKIDFYASQLVFVLSKFVWNLLRVGMCVRICGTLIAND